MKVLRVLLALACATICLTGCMTTEISTSEVTRQEHIYVRDYGWKLFNCVPFFRSNISQDRVLKELLDSAAKRGKTAHNITFHNYDTIMLNVPLIVCTLPIPYVLCYKEFQVSGELK